MSDDDADGADTRTVRFLDDRSPAPAPASFTAPATTAHLAVYAFRDGQLYHMASADTDDEFGDRMIALGKSHRRGKLARLLRRGLPGRADHEQEQQQGPQQWVPDVEQRPPLRCGH